MDSGAFGMASSFISALSRAFAEARGSIALAVGGTALATAIGLSALPPQYAASAYIAVESRDSTSGAASVLDRSALAREVQAILSREVARRVLRASDIGGGSPILRAVRALPSRLAGALGLSDAAAASGEEARLRVYYDHLSVGQLDHSPTIAVTFRADDPATAVRVANAVVAAYLEQRGETTGPSGALLPGRLVARLRLAGREFGRMATALFGAATLPGPASNPTVRLIARAEAAPAGPAARHPIAIVAGSASMALLATLGVALLRRRRRAAAARHVAVSAPRIAGAVPVACRVPSASAERTPAADARDFVVLFERLCTEARASGHEPRRIAVVGDRPGEHASATAVALARLIAMNDLDVMLLDGGARSRAFPAPREPQQPGLTELLAGEATFAQVIARDRLSRAHVIGHGLARPGKLPIEAYAAIVDALADTYDHVVIDAGPVDRDRARLLARSADVIVLVTAAAEADPAAGRAYEVVSALDGITLVVAQTDERRLPRRELSPAA